jgi:uncharacterized protein (DUF427 family)
MLTGFPVQRPPTQPGRTAATSDGLSMIEAKFNGQVIARSEHTVVVDGNYYFPPADVESRFLRRSRMKSLCPWKGIASYYTVDVEGAHGRNAAWTYRHPLPLARQVKNHVAF